MKITKHAFDRLTERTHFATADFDSRVEKAFCDGARVNQIRSRARRDKLQRMLNVHPGETDIAINSGFVWVFSAKTDALITIYERKMVTARKSASSCLCYGKTRFESRSAAKARLRVEDYETEAISDLQRDDFPKYHDTRNARAYGEVTR